MFLCKPQTNELKSSFCITVHFTGTCYGELPKTVGAMGLEGTEAPLSELASLYTFGYTVYSALFYLFTENLIFKKVFFSFKQAHHLFKTLCNTTKIRDQIYEHQNSGTTTFLESLGALHKSLLQM